MQPHVAERLSRCISTQEKHGGEREKNERGAHADVTCVCVCVSEFTEESEPGMMNYGSARVRVHACHSIIAAGDQWLLHSLLLRFVLRSHGTAASTPGPQSPALATHSVHCHFPSRLWSSRDASGRIGQSERAGAQLTGGLLACRAYFI